jgi:hypothetical protein
MVPGVMILSFPRTIVTAFLALAGALFVPSPATAASPRFVQDRFVIGFWVPPQVTQDELPARYEEIAAANFNVVVGNSGASPVAQIDACTRLGLRTLVGADGPVTAYPEGEGCWGYLLVDEPNAGAFPDLGRRVAELRQARPGRLAYINLFPNYASPAQLGTATYDEHVARFMREVQPDVLSMDHYPLMRPDGDTRDAYCANLETMWRHAHAAGVPFWNYFYSMPFNDRLDPTEAQLRWQIFTAAAYGARGVLYFCYWTPGKGNAGTGEFPKGGAILTAEGRKTRHYDESRRINAELKALGPTLMQLTRTGVWRVNTGGAPAAVLTNSPIRDVQRVRTDPHSELILGAFRHADGRRAVLVVNHSYSHTAWPTVEFAVPPSEVTEVDKATGLMVPAVDDSPELPGFQMSLGAGDGRLFLLPATP